MRNCLNYRSLWDDTAIPAPWVSSLEGNVSADVAIVGAGFTGLSAALHLAEAGTNVVLLDSHDVGWGASGRNGGMVIPGLKQDPNYLVSQYGEFGESMAYISGLSADFVFTLIEKHNIACEVQRRGWIQPAHKASLLPKLFSRYEQWEKRGAKCRWLTKKEIRGYVGHEKYFGGWIDYRGGGLNPLSYVRGLAKAALLAGARIYGSSAVKKLEKFNGKWQLITPSGVVFAEQVVIATNGYTSDLWSGLRQSIIPVYSMQVATKPLSRSIRQLILPEGEVLSDTRRILWYFRQDSHGRLIMGGGGSGYKIGTEKIYKELRERIRTLLPQSVNVNFKYSWYGKIAVTPDSLPHLHNLAPGLWAGLGYNGRGVAMATMMGKILCDKTLGRIDLANNFPISRLQPALGLRFNRFVVSAASQYYRFRDYMDG